MPKINSKQAKIIAIGGVIVLSLVILGILIVRADPDYISDTFTDESKIGKGTEKVEIATTTGQVTLAQCYSSNPSWNWSTTTIVRDISSLSSSATTTKKIFCDDYNCILLPDGAATPTAPVCIATDSNVYGNILWSKTDVIGTKTWADSNFAISGGDVGGTHASGLLVGNNNVSVGSKNWLERYYTSAAGTFDAMDACKAKGNAWRLPTILELDSIRDQAKGSAPYSRLPDILADYYWSSSEDSGTYACYLIFTNGAVGSYLKSNNYYVRCLRGQ